jgi:hypothetical protein
MQKRKKKGKLLPFFAFFFFSMICFSVFFFSFFLLEKKKMICFSVFFFSFFLLEKKKMPRRKCLKRKGKNRRPKAGAKSERAERELESKLPPFFAFFFLLYGFFFFSFALEEKDARRKRLKQKDKSERAKGEPKVRGHNGSLKESSLPSLQFFSYL